VSADDPSSFADLAEEMASDDAPSDAFEAVALTTAERADRENPLDATTEEEVEEALEAAMFGEGAGQGDAGPSDESDGDTTVQLVPRPAAAPRAFPSPDQLPPVVVVAPELPLLEWVKRVLECNFRRVHIFQKAELAVQRMRQYMSRGDSPLVLVSPDLADVVARMKKQSPRSPVLWLGERAKQGKADGAVPCAPSQDAASPAGPEPGVGDALRAAVLEALGAPVEAAAAAADAAPASDRLAEVTARLEDPETRGEVLNVALAFAAEHFERVALFLVRDGQAEGLAALGFERASGPGDDAVREISVRAADSRWLAAVLEGEAPVRAAADGPGDHELAARLGDGVPGEAWLAPVISGDRVVAILYGDNLPSGEPLGPSEALEAALERAGRVLEQAMEERARGEG
jgi:hypothetical protein